MQTPTSISLVLTDVSSLKRLADSQATISHGGFYQVIASGLLRARYAKHVLHDLGNKLIGLAEHCYAFRQMDTLQQISQMLLTLPLSRHNEIAGRYYQALCIQRLGAGDIERAARLLERVAESASPRYRVRAMISLGADSFYERDYQSALSLYSEAGRLALRNDVHDPYATLTAQRMVGAIHGLEGNHRDAVGLLEHLFPLAQAMRGAQPHVYYDYLNSLAVELCEVERLEEARNASQIVLASPFAAAYPEWRETREEIELRGYRASRSVVAVKQGSSDRAIGLTTADATLGLTTASATVGLATAAAATVPEAPECGKLVRLPVPERSESLCAVTPSGRTATVLDMQEWKNKVPERKTRKDREARRGWLQKLHAGELVPLIWGRIGDDDVDDNLLREVLLLLGEPGPDEDPGA